MDSFFQNFKTNRKAAREALIDQHRIYSVNSMISVALRQEMNFDSSTSGVVKPIIHSTLEGKNMLREFNKSCSNSKIQRIYLS
jgi:hypothetical protein